MKPIVGAGERAQSSDVAARSSVAAASVLSCGLLTILMAVAQSARMDAYAVLFVVVVVILGVIGFLALGHRPLLVFCVFHYSAVLGAFLLGKPSLTQLLLYMPLAFIVGHQPNVVKTLAGVGQAMAVMIILYLIVPYCGPAGGVTASSRVLIGTLTSVIFLGAPAAAGAWLQWSAERRELAEHLLLLERRERAAALAEALQDQRDQMTRELHDVASHHLTAVLLNAKLARRAVASHPDRAALLLKELEQEAGRATISLREIAQWVADPSDVPMAPQPQLRDVEVLVDNTRRIAPRIELQITGDLSTTTPAVELAGYRIVQESLTNAIRYAPGSDITVTIANGPDELIIRVDNTHAREPSSGVSGGGAGVRGMELRARLLGGSASAGPTALGWRVEARFPRLEMMPTKE
ncbi:sensor histidine kinase [Luteococcus sp.]|uniref:sensor histidine kinase n=1 Tax=Luteococcus sp. TaxID=1969402 RepID=UPI00373524DA